MLGVVGEPGGGGGEPAGRLPLAALFAAWSSNSTAAMRFCMNMPTTHTKSKAMIMIHVFLLISDAFSQFEPNYLTYLLSATLRSLDIVADLSPSEQGDELRLCGSVACRPTLSLNLAVRQFNATSKRTSVRRSDNSANLASALNDETNGAKRRAVLKRNSCLAIGAKWD